MISADRFVANKAYDFDGWLKSRRQGVTATQVAKASTASGFDEVVNSWHDETPVPDNPYMQFGRESEGWIALWVKREFGVMPNEWLIRHESDPIAYATPDGVSVDHRVISEVKTTGKVWSVDKLPIQYRRQVQWQLYVTGAESCVFAWIRRVEVDGRFVTADFTPHTVSIERDEKMIEKLCATAQRLWQETGGQDANV